MRTQHGIGAIAVGQNHIYIPPVSGSYTGTPRLLLGFHGSGSSAFTETLLAKSNYMLRSQAFAKAGFAQLWIDGGPPGVTLTAASSVSATSLAVSAAVYNGSYLIDPQPPNNYAPAEIVTVSGAPTGGTTTPTITAATRAHAAGTVMTLTSGGSGWGNDADLVMADTAWTWAKANLSIKTDKVVTYGNSAGNAWALGWALRSGAVLAHAGSLPVVDIQDIHDNNRQSLAANIQMAYSGNGTSGSTPNDAWYAAKSPVRNQGALSAVPQKFWYSSTDTIGLAALSAAYCTAVGAMQIDMGTAGHAISTPAPYGCFPYNDAATFLKTYQ